MIRPTGNASDHPHTEWCCYWDFITAAASSGHHLELAWDSGVAYVATGEDPMGTHLSFWPCTPRWVATWTLSDAEHRAESADADPLLLPVADGPSVDADSSNVGEWMARVITTVAGRNPARPSHRDFRAVGYTSEPGQ